MHDNGILPLICDNMLRIAQKGYTCYLLAVFYMTKAQIDAIGSHGEKGNAKGSISFIIGRCWPLGMGSSDAAHHCMQDTIEALRKRSAPI